MNESAPRGAGTTGDARWRPMLWITLVLGIVLQPFVFLYINRPRLFALYLLLAVGVPLDPGSSRKFTRNS